MPKGQLNHVGDTELAFQMGMQSGHNRIAIQSCGAKKHHLSKRLPSCGKVTENQPLLFT